MKTKKQSLLHDHIIEVLEQSGLNPLYIEFFGQISGMARALNNINGYKASNPVKIAHGFLAKERTVEMFKDFILRKKAKTHPPVVADHEDADAILREYIRWTKNNLEPHYTQEEINENAPDE